MRTFRRRFASCALALTLLQAALLFAAPAAACCPSRTAAPVRAAKADCCPAGAHAPGECPLHRDKAEAAAAQKPADCAMRCDATHSPDFVLGAMGVLPRPVAEVSAADSSRFDLDLSVTPRAHRTLPDAPPPRTL